MRARHALEFTFNAARRARRMIYERTPPPMSAKRCAFDVDVFFFRHDARMTSARQQRAKIFFFCAQRDAVTRLF